MEAFWTDQTLTWGALGLMAYFEKMNITRIEDSELPSFLRGAYYHHPDDRGDLDESVDVLLSLGYLQFDGDTLTVHPDGG